MISRLQIYLSGKSLRARYTQGEGLPKWRALAAFSPDGLSSIAYANQEIYLGLVIAGALGLSYSWPIALAIAILLGLVALSYYQTIQGYPSGGGSYVVARENLGAMAGLVAGAALLVDYILTTAVSLTAAVAAIASVFPELWAYGTVLALILLVFLTLLNLRGMEETTNWVSIPVYLFLFTYLLMIAYGLFRLLADGPSHWSDASLVSSQSLTSYLVLHTFASGCTALTGIEAISNGVPAFRVPQARNAGITLLVLALLMAALFLGSIGLIQGFAVLPNGQETILSALAHRVLGRGFGYHLVQLSTLLILSVAANTSFAGFPRLAAVIAQDGFLPRTMTNLGERQVYRNGILLLALISGVLILIFRGDTHALIPLFAVGVFVAFTLSQVGMARHWWYERSNNWQIKIAFNAIGATATTIALIIIGFSKFLNGAWIVIVLLAALVALFLHIEAHYANVRKELSLRGLPPSLHPYPQMRLVIPISGVHRGVIEAVKIARSISSNITAVYIELDPGSGEQIQRDWETWFPDIPIAILPSPHRTLIGPLLNFLDAQDEFHHDGQLAAVVLPEFVPAKWWHSFLHNQNAWIIKAALLYRRRHLGFQRVIIDVPFHLRR